MSTESTWKQGHGKLGNLAPLIGTWHAEAAAPDGRPGRVYCKRRFKQVLDNSYIELTAIWHMDGAIYEERAFFGCDATGKMRFWSFTSDGKQSNGELTDATDIHPEAIGFIAQMPAGIARHVYWPHETQGFHWAVESQTTTGWDRFVDHHYVPDAQPMLSDEKESA